MMLMFSDLWQILKQPAIFSICAVVFIADVITGMVGPTLPLFATGLGASVALIGLLTGLVNVVSILAAFPIGIWSDVWGRKQVIVSGGLLFVVAYAGCAFAANVYALFPVLMLAGVAALCVFTVSTAYVGDVARRGERGLVIGLYSTAMGLGAAIGPALGGLLAEQIGYQINYLAAAAIGLGGCWIAWRYLLTDPTAGRNRVIRQRTAMGAQLRLLLHDPNVLTASLGNFCINTLYSTIFGFLPLYAAELTWNKAAIGSLFATRALASTVARIPTGVLTNYVTSHLLMLASLLVAAAATLFIAGVQHPVALTVVIAVEGLAYGIFLTAGRTYLADTAAEETRGAAIGVYGMAGSVGGALSPLVFGLLAERWGLPIVFIAAALVLLVGALLLWRRSLLPAEVGASNKEGRS